MSFRAGTFGPWRRRFATSSATSIRAVWTKPHFPSRWCRKDLGKVLALNFSLISFLSFNLCQHWTSSTTNLSGSAVRSRWCRRSRSCPANLSRRSFLVFRNWPLTLAPAPTSRLCSNWLLQRDVKITVRTRSHFALTTTAVFGGDHRWE